jgi:aminomethyltransferase
VALLDPGVVHDAECRLLSATGDDAADFLHALVTQDLAGQRSGASRYAALADDRAHYLADFWVWRTTESWLLEVEGDLAASLAARLERFVISEDVRVEELGFDGVHLEGAGAPSVAVETLRTGLPPTEEIRVLAGAGGPGFVLRRTRYGEPGVTVFAPAGAAVLSLLRDAALRAGLRQIGPGERTRLRIEAGRARGGVDITEDDLVQEAGLQAAISLTKGCFPGQEIVRRVTVAGQLRRRLAGVRFPGSDAGPSLVGASLHPSSAPAAGRVTSAAAAPERHETVALAWIAAEYAAPGTSVTARGTFGEVPGEVAALPMHHGSEDPPPDVIRYPEGKQ